MEFQRTFSLAPKQNPDSAQRRKAVPGKDAFRRVPREHRSLWLGHTVRDGSRTTSHYEGDDPLALADVALATDCVLALLAERCERNLFAIESRPPSSDRRAVYSKEVDKIEKKWWARQGSNL